MATYTFSKPEHLCLNSEIEALFGAGSSSLSMYPLRATYRTLPYEGHGPRVKVLLSVSKRRLRHAVDRNRAKRQLREAYRLQKQLLWNRLPEGKALHIAFIWLAVQPADSARVTKRMHALLQQMAERIEKAAQTPAEP
ncbi:MAG: ribonuclease P protein component [Alloprevotella sp.]